MGEIMTGTLRILTDEEVPCVAGGSSYWPPYEFFMHYLTYDEYWALYGQWHPTP